MYIKSLITIVASFFVFTIYGQTIKPLEDEKLLTHINETNIYFKDVNNTLDKYFGTWIYEDDMHYFKITFFKKEQKRISGNRDWYFDELVCEYLYKINGVEIYNTYGINSTVDNYDANLIYGAHLNSENEVRLSYSELPINGCIRAKSAKLLLEFITEPSGAQAELRWTRTNYRTETVSSECSDGNPIDTSDLLIPEDMILTKE